MPRTFRAACRSKPTAIQAAAASRPSPRTLKVASAAPRPATDYPGPSRGGAATRPWTMKTPPREKPRPRRGRLSQAVHRPALRGCYQCRPLQVDYPLQVRALSCRLKRRGRRNLPPPPAEQGDARARRNTARSVRTPRRRAARRGRTLAANPGPPRRAASRRSVRTRAPPPRRPRTAARDRRRAPRAHPRTPRARGPRPPTSAAHTPADTRRHASTTAAEAAAPR